MNIFQPLRKWNRYQEIYGELQRKSDRQLRDIGISREEISTIAKAAVRGS